MIHIRHKEWGLLISLLLTLLSISGMERSLSSSKKNLCNNLDLENSMEFSKHLLIENKEASILKMCCQKYT